MIMNRELSKKFNFETKYLSRQPVRCGKYNPKNSFDFRGVAQTLIRHGFTISPYRLETDNQGYLTRTCWLWRAFKKGYQIDIYFNAPDNALS